MAFTLEQLDVYTLAQEFSDRVWFIVSSWNYFERKGIGYQLTSSSDSISSNIAEGYGRYYNKENVNFCFYARGSLMETKNWLLKSKNRNLIDVKDYDELILQLSIIHEKLNGYIKYLRKPIQIKNSP